MAESVRLKHAATCSASRGIGAATVYPREALRCDRRSLEISWNVAFEAALPPSSHALGTVPPQARTQQRQRLRVLASNNALRGRQSARDGWVAQRQ